MRGSEFKREGLKAYNSREPRCFSSIAVSSRWTSLVDIGVEVNKKSNNGIINSPNITQVSEGWCIWKVPSMNTPPPVTWFTQPEITDWPSGHDRSWKEHCQQ